jgi:hypothetical protein
MLPLDLIPFRTVAELRVAIIIAQFKPAEPEEERKRRRRLSHSVWPSITRQSPSIMPASGVDLRLLDGVLRCRCSNRARK